MKKNNLYILIFLGLAVLILWQMLLPGYVLGLDMVFTPEMKVIINPDGFNNFLPVGYLIYWISLVIPVWLIQKIIFIILFFNIGYLAFKYLPVGENKTARMFSALIYLVNPFVYSRFLAGHWTHLMAYGFLPMFVYFLFGFTKVPSFKSGLKLFGTLFLISVFSIHFFIMTVLILLIWSLYYLIKYLYQKKRIEFWALFKNLSIAGFIFLIISSYWLIPAFSRDQPIEQRFDVEHWQEFSAGGYANISPILNVVSLNGFWGERNPWAKYFVWPQDYAVFWMAFVFIAFFILIGLISNFKNKKSRNISIFFGILGILSFIFATGAGDTVFKNLNLWFYTHISFWSGFRDSQKFSGLLALSYAFFAGLGFVSVLEYFKKKKPAVMSMFLSLVFIIPILFGYLIWGGFHKQIQPVWYPESWFEAKKIIDNGQSDNRVLFLPWHGYMSLDFNNKIISSNPGKRFFGDRIFVSKNVELGRIYDQETDTEYNELDRIIKDNLISSEEKLDLLIKRCKIRWIVKIQDLKDTDNLIYDFLTSARIEKRLERDDILVYEIKG